MMELARVFKEKGTKRTLRFIAWGSEEMGLDGSNMYAKRIKEDDKAAKEKDEDAKTELDKTRLAVNLDGNFVVDDFVIIVDCQAQHVRSSNGEGGGGIHGTLVVEFHATRS